MAKECSNSSCSKESCEGCPSKAGQGKPDFHIDLNADSSIKHVIGVVSGKGGVGKSMVTASLANQKAKEGYKVGILDADITGPSIPKMYGLKGPANVDDKGVYPAVAANGVKVMSINLLLPGEEEPVIWRGPVIAGTVKQFWTDVIWGDLDYLFVDMSCTRCIAGCLAVFSAGGAASTVACVITRFSAAYDTGKLARSTTVASAVCLAG